MGQRWWIESLKKKPLPFRLIPKLHYNQHWGRNQTVRWHLAIFYLRDLFRIGRSLFKNLLIVTVVLNVNGLIVLMCSIPILNLFFNFYYDNFKRIFFLHSCVLPLSKPRLISIHLLITPLPATFCPIRETPFGRDLSMRENGDSHNYSIHIQYMCAFITLLLQMQITNTPLNVYKPLNLFYCKLHYLKVLF